MKALAAVLSLFLAWPVYAADDAPLIITAGTPAPVSGLLLPDALAVEQAKRIRGCEAERDALKAAPAPMHPALVVGLVVLSVVGGVAAGYGVALATR